MSRLLCPKCKAINGSHLSTCRICGTPRDEFLDCEYPSDKLDRALTRFKHELSSGSRSWPLDNSRDALIVSIAEFLLAKK